MSKKATIYARVSSEGDRQNTDRQVVDLQAILSGYLPPDTPELFREFEVAVPMR